MPVNKRLFEALTSGVADRLPTWNVLVYFDIVHSTLALGYRDVRRTTFSR